MATSKKVVIYAALIGNGLIAIMKFIAAFFTGSSAMLSEGIHSVVDTGNQIFLLYGLKRAEKPADSRFPFGYGKEIYFWSFIVAMMIFAVGAGISIYEGINHLLHPQPLENVFVSYIVLSLAMVFEGVAWTIAFREFTSSKGEWGYLEAVRRGKDPTLFMVLFEDTAAIAGLLVALSGTILTQVTGNLYVDGIAAIVIGIILATTAAWLAWETKGLLIGESANLYVVDGIKKLAKSFDSIIQTNEVLTVHMGPEYILANISVNFDATASALEIQQTVSQFDAAIKENYTNVKRVFIEGEARHRQLSSQSV